MVAFLQAEMMKRDPENHTRWRHKWRWHNRGNVWDKIATDWTGKEDWVREREVKSTLVDKYKFVTFALDSVKLFTLHKKKKKRKDRKEGKEKTARTWGPRMPPLTLERTRQQHSCVETMMLRANGSMGKYPRGTSTEEELAQVQKTLEKEVCGRSAIL